MFHGGRWTRSTDAGDFCKTELGRTRDPAPGRGEIRETVPVGDSGAAGGSDEWPRKCSFWITKVDMHLL